MFDELITACQTESAGSIAEILSFFLDECESEQAPTAEVVQTCRDILAARGGKFERLAQLCQQALEESA